MTADLINQIFEVCIIPLLGILTTYLVKFLKAKMNTLSQDATNELEKKYINMLSETVTKCVIATNQTYVDSLKQQGKFDAEAQKTAFKLTYDSVLAILSDEAKKYVTESVGDFETYVTTLIEQNVNENKLEVITEEAQ